MQEKLELIRELLHNHDYQLYFEGKHTEKLQVIMQTVDYIMGLHKERKEDFLKLANELSKAYSLCATTKEAELNNVEIGFYKTVRAGILKLSISGGGSKGLDKLDAELNQLISRSLKSDEVIDIMSEIGLAKPDISILLSLIHI